MWKETHDHHIKLIFKTPNTGLVQNWETLNAKPEQFLATDMGQLKEISPLVEFHGMKVSIFEGL